ncbi:ubiquitin carboxyl-terminal hydrolase 1 [Bacillus rossius redtenbacheri]|uniref:ubiquitin carboxyl-terminal hydrolase 1 n=1 Tax=Bacillus rossius redtenbacheri TaxID=93214 RepID=UPI002FDCD942
MTVLSEENAAGESSRAPPRKKICLSLGGHGKLVRTPYNELTHARRGCLVLPERYQELGYSSSPRSSRSITSKDRDLLNPLEGDATMNGYLAGDSHKGSADESPGSDAGAGCSPVATLCNLGNTCFLNSVLYTLRFAPAFLHNLHHLVADLAEVSSRSQLMKIKSSSLGRNISASSSKSWSSKDLLSLGPGVLDLPFKSRIQLATERLHELYESLHASELKDRSEPFQPDVFLHALREVNPIFEGNQQHDAHELLVCLLDNIRETCRLLATQAQASQLLGESVNGLADREPGPPPPAPGAKGSSWTVRKSWKLKRSSSSASKNGLSNGSAVLLKEPEQALLNGGQHLSGIAETADAAAGGESQRGGEDTEAGRKRAVGYNFVSADFEGVTILRTRCMECEHETERKETFSDICVPITTDTAGCPVEEVDGPQRVSEVYQAAIVTSENLRDGNKYWCEQCLRYNEARRSVCYETLPRLLVLQLKRFSSTFGSMVCMSKVNDYMPTPLRLACFCEKCLLLPEEERPHEYELYGVIMHLGATIASGHYVAYVRASDGEHDYHHCERDRRKAHSLTAAGKPASQGSGSGEKVGGLFKFLSRPKSSAGGSADPSGKLLGPNTGYRSARLACRSMDCCGVKLGQSLADGDPAPHHAYAYGSLRVNGDAPSPEPAWLECDDETVRALSRKEFEDVLAPKPSKVSALTPYLLFYSRRSRGRPV